jgi:hypothetical protein
MVVRAPPATREGRSGRGTGRRQPVRTRRWHRIQWPRTSGSPDGTPRLYADGIIFAGHDTCESHRKDLVTGASVEPLEMLAQVAQATKDERLLGLATDCHPETLRQVHWTNTMLKELSPQLLSST